MPSLQFKGKALVQNHHLVVPFSELEAVKKSGVSKSPSLHDNLIIEGDNLKALKALLPAFHGKIKCIYIDPPYNTGNEGWIYNDRVNSPMIRDWLGKTVDRDDLTRHDKWCCMMLPRLKMLRELLSDDGAIFVSIDDNEVHHLRALMDEVFTEENFITTFIWKKKGTSTNVTGASVSEVTEYVVAYARSNGLSLNSRVKAKETRTYPLHDKQGDYRLTIIEKKHAGSYARESMRFKILGHPPRDGKRWQIGEETARDYEKQKRFEVGQDGIVRLKIYEFEDRDTLSAWPNLLDNLGTTESAAKLVNDEIFEQPELFESPKPLELIQHIIKISTDADDIILDATAGSGTTAHAVLTLNKEDNENRRFILCQMPYETKEQEQNKENICDTVTAERVRRVIKGVPKAKDEALREGLGGTFSYFKLGKELQKQAILDGKDLPSYASLAGYVFFTATGEEFKPTKMKRKSWFIGPSRDRDVFLIYEDDIEKLKDMALNLELARSIASFSDRPKLVFAPTKYLDQDYLDHLRIEFCQLPFEIYQHASK